MSAKRTTNLIKVLLIGGSEDDHLRIRGHLSRSGQTDHHLDWVSSWDEAERALGNGGFDVGLLDCGAGEVWVIEVLCQLRTYHPSLPVITLGQEEDSRIAANAMALGASDHLIKDATDAALLERAIRYAITINATRREAEQGSMFFDVSLDMLCIANCQGYFERLNPSWEGALGFSVDELMSKPLHHFVHPEDKDATVAALEVLQKGPTTLAFINRFVHKNGSYIWLSWKATAIAESGHIFAVARDITQNKKQEQSLVESKEQVIKILAQLEQAQRLARIGSWELEFPTRKVTLSDETYRIFGFSPRATQLTFENYFAVVHPDDRPRVRSIIEEAVSSKTGFVFRHRITVPGGERIVLQHGQVTRDEDGNPVGLLGTAQDITDRWAAEEKLRESEERFRLALSSGTVSVYEQDRDLRYRWLYPDNEGTERLIGRTDRDLDGAGAQVRESVKRRVIETGERIHQSVPVLLNGEERWFDIQVEPRRDASGRIRGVLGTSIDITDRIRAERAEMLLLELSEDLANLTDVSEIMAVSSVKIGRFFNVDNCTYVEFDIKADTVSVAYDWRRDNTGVPRSGDYRISEFMSDAARGPFISGSPIIVQNVNDDPVTKGSAREYEALSIGAFVTAPYLSDGQLKAAITIQTRGARKWRNDEVQLFRELTARIWSRIDRARAEQALRESEERYRSLVSILTDVPWTTNAIGAVVEMQPAWTDYTGQSWEEMNGFGWVKAIHPDDRDKMSDCWDIAVAERSVFEAEVRVFHAASGAFRHMVARATPLMDAEGNVRQWVGTYTDVDDTRRAEEYSRDATERAIREYERLLERVSRLAECFGCARDIQSIFSALTTFAVESTGCTGMFISLYDAKHNIRTLSYAWSDGSEDDVSKLPPMPMSDSPHSRAVLTGETIITDDFQSAIEGQPVVNVGLDRDPALPQSSLVTPMSVMGRIIGAIEIQSTSQSAFSNSHATAMKMAANLTANALENVRLLEEERRKDEQLRQSQRMESVGKLAGGIAHDFNNMLTAINGYSDLILRRLDKDDPNRNHLAEIKKAGERSASLTRQLLAFSRQQVLQPKLLCLNDVISDTSTLLERLIGEHIQLDLRLDPKIGFVLADPGQLSQVIINLAVNARDAMPGGGKLIVETASATLDDRYALSHYPAVPGKYVLMVFTDTGEGIDSETQQRIFEPFFTTKEMGKGTGLGLATVYGIIKQSGGYIWVYSEKGLGTTFKIYLPVAEQSCEDYDNEEGQSDLIRGAETILLVEDERAVRDLSKEILQECGYNVLEAANGREALDVIRRFEPKIDLLISDVVMPEMGGTELAERLSQSHPDLKVLLISGYTDAAAIDKGIIDPNVRFLQKPFTFETLSDKIRSVLDEV